METIYLIIGFASGALIASIIALFLRKSNNKSQSLEKENLNRRLEDELKRGSELSSEVERIRLDNSTLKAEKAKVAATLEKTTEQLADERNMSREREMKYEETLKMNRNLSGEKGRLEKELEILQKQNREDAAKRDALFTEQLRLAKEEIKTLSQTILEERQKKLQETNKTQMESILTPLEKQLRDLKDRANEIHEKNISDRAAMAKELEQLRKMNENISKEANDLTHALKGETKAQGNWGEMLLERQLEYMGFEEGKHYKKQSFIKDECGLDIKNEEGKRLQPDIIIQYPQGREVIIDSKVSLTNYVNFIGATDEQERTDQLKKHISSLKRHIEELSAKQYGRYNSKSPEFVMMFVPNESAYITAIKEDSNLWNFAFDRKILIVGPTSILSALQLALDLWKREDQSVNIQKIIDEVCKLYDKMASFCKTFKGIGDNISNTQKKYDEALKQLSEGRGNIIGRFDNIQKMGLSPKSKIALSAKNGTDESSESTENLDELS
mgnify:FL=1